MSDQQAVMQVVKFSIKSDVNRDDFLALNQRFQNEVASELPGLERRESTVSEDGKVMLFLRYQDMASATVGPKADAGNEVAQQVMTMVDMSTMSAEFYPLV